MKNCITILTEKQQKRQLAGEKILSLDQSRMIGEVKFTYSPLEKYFQKQMKTIENQEKKQIKTIKENGKQLVKSNGIIKKQDNDTGKDNATLLD